MTSPTLSVLIPTKLRPEILARCLRELNLQSENLPNFPIEIIVSEDSLENASKPVVARYPNAYWTSGPQRGPAANRNHAATEAKGKWLLFLDDDVLPLPGCLQAYAKAIDADSSDVLEGQMVCTGERNSPFYRMAENRSGGNLFTANLAIRRQTFVELEGFDEELIIMEDLEFAHRLRAEGKKIHFVKNATVDHPAHPLGWSYAWRWIFHFRWGLLLAYKTGISDPRRSFLRSLLAVTGEHLLLLLRKTIHLFTQHNPRSWANAWFWQIWGWLTLPIALPNLWHWELRYRRRFRNSTSSGIGHAQAQT